MLDLLSVNNYIGRYLINPSSFYFCVYEQSEVSILRINDRVIINIDSHVEFTIKDKNGNIIPQPEIPKPKYTPAFRYYRLSQSSHDIFEAYNYIFLALESILSEICPPNNGEREKEWYPRALAEVSTKIPLSNYVPTDSSSDPISYIYSEYYGKIRCNLLHAKKGKSIVPQCSVNPIDIENAYSKVVGLWRAMARQYFNISRSGRGVVNCGFESLIEGMLKEGYIAHYTSDPTPENKKELKISPLNHPILSSAPSSSAEIVSPGRIAAQNTISPKCLGDVKNIRRICLEINGKINSIAAFDFDIAPIGVDSIESRFIYGFTNTQMPKMEF